jgi:hypothetical protein
VAAALKRAFGLAVTPVSVSGGGDVLTDVSAETAFLCNHSDHWFAIRQIHGMWFNLNSLLEAPEVRGDTPVAYAVRCLWERSSPDVT